MTEPAYDEAGGPAYQALRDEMESVQTTFLSAWSAARADKIEPPTLAPLRRKMEQLQADFESARQEHALFVRQQEHEAARAFWKVNDPHIITDTYFADEPHAPAARMARIHPPWWGAFHLRLQKIFLKGHPAEGHLLDALPEVRRAAGKRSKFTLEATVKQWRQSQQDRLGWYCDKEPHYRVISRRASKIKAEQLNRWLDQIAPGYRLNQSVRVTLHAELTERLGAADPWSMPVRPAALPWGEHGSN